MQQGPQDMSTAARTLADHGSTSASLAESVGHGGRASSAVPENESPASRGGGFASRDGPDIVTRGVGSDLVDVEADGDYIVPEHSLQSSFERESSFTDVELDEYMGSGLASAESVDGETIEEAAEDGKRKKANGKKGKGRAESAARRARRSKGRA